MQLATKRKGGAISAALSGELDHHNAAVIREKLDTLLDDGINELTLDMSGITFMDSSGIGVILGRYRRMSERGGKMYIKGVNDYSERILRMAGVLALVERK